MSPCEKFQIVKLWTVLPSCGANLITERYFADEIHSGSRYRPRNCSPACCRLSRKWIWPNGRDRRAIAVCNLDPWHSAAKAHSKRGTGTRSLDDDDGRPRCGRRDI